MFSSDFFVCVVVLGTFCFCCTKVQSYGVLLFLFRFSFSSWGLSSSSSSPSCSALSVFKVCRPALFVVVFACMATNAGAFGFGYLFF